MRFSVSSRNAEELIVVFEPSAHEVTISGGDYLTVEWTGEAPGEIEWTPEYLSIGSPAGGNMYAWTSDGNEIEGII